VHASCTGGHVHHRSLPVPVALQVTYIGHATLLLELDGRRILTDPNFDSRLGRVLARVSPPGIGLEELPPLDGMLLTHAHADHLSFDSLARLPQDIPLLAPPPLARWLARGSYPRARALAPGEFADLRGVTVHAAAARHVGSRYVADRWRGAANMYLLETPSATVFFAGDTALTPETHRMVADRLHAAGRALDVALLPIGHAPWWKPGFRRGHLTSEDALTLFERLDARVMIPYHWGTFNHVTSTAFDAITRLRGLLSTYNRSEDVRILEPGESYSL